MIELILPYPPSVNHYKQVGRLTRTKTGKIYQQRVNSDATKRFYYEVWMKIQQGKAKEGLKSFDDATISVEIDIYPPDARKRDIDNLAKVVLDSLQKTGMYDDDNQVARLLLCRKKIESGGKLVVRIQTIDPDAQKNEILGG